MMFYQIYMLTQEAYYVVQSYAILVDQKLFMDKSQMEVESI